VSGLVVRTDSTDRITLLVHVLLTLHSTHSTRSTRSVLSDLPSPPQSAIHTYHPAGRKLASDNARYGPLDMIVLYALNSAYICTSLTLGLTGCAKVWERLTRIKPNRLGGVLRWTDVLERATC